MAEDQFIRPHLETAVEIIDRGRDLFDDLVGSNKLIEDLCALTEDSLRAIVFERVIAARTTEPFVPDARPGEEPRD